MGPDGNLSEPVSVSLPDQTLIHCDAASITYRRSFNRPSGINQQTAVLLDCGLLPLATTARLNGQPIVIPEAGFPQIRSLLRPHNELEIVLSSDCYAEASLASAKLEIVEGC